SPFWKEFLLFGFHLTSLFPFFIPSLHFPFLIWCPNLLLWRRTPRSGFSA
ncbi:hypothetical protein Csa_023970, partial [Cucumis sativus]